MFRKVLFLVMPFVFISKAFGFHNLRINGSETATVTAGDTMVITGYFEAPGETANVCIYADLNENGVIDAPDKKVIWGRIFDGEYDDENEAEDGFYEEIDKEGLPVSGQFIYYAEDNGVSDEVVITIMALSSSYSISGKITEPPNTAGIMVHVAPGGLFEGGDFMYGDITDANGDYQIYIPDSLGNTYWGIIPMDLLCIIPGYVAPVSMDNVLVDGHITGQDIAFIASDGVTISGDFKDDDDNLLGDDLQIMVFEYWFTATDSFAGIAFTKTTPGGSYTIDVCGGLAAYLMVQGDAGPLYPDYLGPEEIQVMYMFGQPTNITADITAYKADTVITGHVYKDGNPADNIEIRTEDSDWEIGETRTGTFSDGRYKLRVASESSGYEVYIENVPDGYYVEEGSQYVAPGATDVDFHLVKIGIEESLKVQKSNSLKVLVCPNPFSTKTVIGFQVPDVASGFLPDKCGRQAPTLQIYDLSGRLVRSLKPSTVNHQLSTVIWDGTDNSGKKVKNGVYFLKLECTGVTTVSKLVKIR